MRSEWASTCGVYSIEYCSSRFGYTLYVLIRQILPTGGLGFGLDPAPSVPGGCTQTDDTIYLRVRAVLFGRTLF